MSFQLSSSSDGSGAFCDAVSARVEPGEELEDEPGFIELCKRASSSWKDTLRLVVNPETPLDEHANRNGYLLLTKSRFDSPELIAKNEERKRLLGDRDVWKHEGEGELVNPEVCKQLEPNLTDLAVAAAFFSRRVVVAAPDVF